MHSKCIWNGGLSHGNLKGKLKQNFNIHTTEWRIKTKKYILKEREYGLLKKYKPDDQFRKLCGFFDRLAFLPPQLVPEGLTYIRETSTGDIGYLLDYFDCMYVNGPLRLASVPSAVAPRENSSLCLTAPKTTGVSPRTIEHVRRHYST